MEQILAVIAKESEAHCFPKGTVLKRVEPDNPIETFLERGGCYIFEGEYEGGIVRQSLESNEYEYKKIDNNE